jgi:hypothetical protein
MRIGITQPIGKIRQLPFKMRMSKSPFCMKNRSGASHEKGNVLGWCCYCIARQRYRQYRIFVLSFLFSEDCVFRLLISGLAFVYILYMLSRSQERNGRITVMSIWFMQLIMLWLFYPPISLFVILHVLAIWLVRSLYCYASLFSSLADLGLNTLSISSAFWALHHAGRLFLTLWCFFLVQALFVYIPTGIKRPSLDKIVIANNASDFKRAYQKAEAAVRKLSSCNQEKTL